MENGKHGAFSTGTDHYHQIGLTKREYFAGLAMQGLLVNYNANMMWGNHPNFPMVEAAAVRCADQLLAELEKPQP